MRYGEKIDEFPEIVSATFIGTDAQECCTI